jgi:hypothetical protein
MSYKPKSGKQQHNGALLTLSTILRMVVASAAEAEVGAPFLDTKEGVNIRNILREMGHPQPATPLQTDNTTAHVILRGTVRVNSNAVKRSTCAFTGYGIAQSKISLTLDGTHQHKTLAIILPSIIHRPTTKGSGKCT